MKKGSDAARLSSFLAPGTGHLAAVGVFPWVSERGDKPHAWALMWSARRVMVHVNSMRHLDPAVIPTHPQTCPSCSSLKIVSLVFSRRFPVKGSYVRLALLSRTVKMITSLEESQK